MLYKEQLAIRFQHSAPLRKRAVHLGDTAHRPRRHDRINLALSIGIASAVPSMSSSAFVLRPPASRAMLKSFSDGSIPVTCFTVAP